MRVRLVVAASLALAAVGCGDSSQDKLGDDLSAAEGRPLDANEANFAEVFDTPPPPPQANVIEPAPVIEPVPVEAERDELAPEPEPSFDCDAAGNQVEEWICENPGLAALDRTLDSNYSRALDAADPARRAMLQRNARLFLSERNRCPDEDCVAQTYRGRLREIADIMASRAP